MLFVVFVYLCFKIRSATIVGDGSSRLLPSFGLLVPAIKYVIGDVLTLASVLDGVRWWHHFFFDRSSSRTASMTEGEVD